MSETGRCGSCRWWADDDESDWGVCERIDRGDSESPDPAWVWDSDLGTRSHFGCTLWEPSGEENMSEQQDTRNRVERAYYEAVAADGYPTDRAQALLLSHPSLVDDCANAVQRMGGFDPRDAFLAGFTAALIWHEDNVADGEPHDTEGTA